MALPGPSLAPPLDAVLFSMLPDRSVMWLGYTPTSFRRPVYMGSDIENYNAHSTMANDPRYGETVVNPMAPENLPLRVTDRHFRYLVTRGPSVPVSQNGEACADFVNITAYIAGKYYNLMDGMFDGMRSRLIAMLPTMTDHQLMTVLKLFPLWNMNINSKHPEWPEYYAFWSELDRECVARYKRWTPNELLLFMDHWYWMKLSRLCNFVGSGVTKLARRPSSLTPRQLVQMMFYANTSRKIYSTVSMYEIELKICSYYNEFNIKELVILSLGFYKTHTPIRNQELIKKLYSSVTRDIDKIKSVELAAFLKIFRCGSRLQNADSMYNFLDLLVDRVNDVDLLCCSHMALLGTNLLIKHEILLKKISQRVVNEISKARIKDIEKMSMSLSILNFNPQTTPCIFETFVNELRSDSRNIDFKRYTKCYIVTLSYLAFNNIFPYDCISKSLETVVLQNCFDKRMCRFNVPRWIVFLNNSLLIECPDYSGPVLPNALKESSYGRLAWHIPTTRTFVSSGDKIFLTIYREFVRFFKNESYLHVCYSLPHHPKPDILFCIDSDGKPVGIPETMKNKTIFHNFKKPPELGKWFAVLVLVKNSFLHNSNVHNGLTVCKIRQIKKLGYEPILITYKEIDKINEIERVISEKLIMHGITTIT